MRKISTGIKGLDIILKGGYPEGCPTLLKAGPGCGKTIFCQLFTNQSTIDHHNVCFVTCDEAPNIIVENMDKLGLQGTVALKNHTLRILDFRPSLADAIVGNFELKAILLRIQNNLTGQNPILIIDSLHNLLIGVDPKENDLTLLELFNWSRENKITLLCTSSDAFLFDREYLFEEYVTDCVILLKQTIRDKLMTRYLRIEKYRGSAHGTNEYPFLLNGNGISLFPITDSQLNNKDSKKRCSTGNPKLDSMLGGGYLEASSIMISGISGTAKSLMVSQISCAAVSNKKKVIYFTYEESYSDFLYNIKSAGINIANALKKHLFILKSIRAVEMGLEEHLINIFDAIDNECPDLVVIDPVTSMLDIGTALEVKSLLVRFVSNLKTRNITIFFIELLKDSKGLQHIIGISSLIDTWIKLDLKEANGEMNRSIQIKKSRGSANSKQIKEFVISNKGIEIQDPYIGGGEIVFGSTKKQKMLLDKQIRLSLQEQLYEINDQIKRLDRYKDKSISIEEIKNENLKFSLQEKKRDLEVKLKNIDAIEFINRQSREK